MKKNLAKPELLLSRQQCYCSGSPPCSPADQPLYHNHDDDDNDVDFDGDVDEKDDGDDDDINETDDDDVADHLHVGFAVVHLDRLLSAHPTLLLLPLLYHHNQGHHHHQGHHHRQD